MKTSSLTFVALAVLLGACSPQSGSGDGEPAAILEVGDGVSSSTYTQTDLEALPRIEATFQGVTYAGVSLGTLLEDAGFPPAGLESVTATAGDGFSAAYDAATVQRPDVIVAYAEIDGPLPSGDGPFRMVVPDGEGKMNVRMLASLTAVP